VDRRFLCRGCNAKWFIHEDRVSEPDLTACGRCGGPLVSFVATSRDSRHGSGVHEDSGELGEDG
jgi:hypothetical protein